jgi:hypothetical protein
MDLPLLGVLLGFAWFDSYNKSAIRVDEGNRTRVSARTAGKEEPAMGNAMAILVFVGFTVAIWLSYRLFMRGDTAKEKVAALLPANFNPDVFHRKGDTYVGYEKQSNRPVLVDWPHAKVLRPEEVQSLAPVHESMLGVTHHWLEVVVPDSDFSRFKIWFQFRPPKRDAWHGRLAVLCKK